MFKPVRSRIAKVQKSYRNTVEFGKNVRKLAIRGGIVALLGSAAVVGLTQEDKPKAPSDQPSSEAPIAPGVKPTSKPPRIENGTITLQVGTKMFGDTEFLERCGELAAPELVEYTYTKGNHNIPVRSQDGHFELHKVPQGEHCNSGATMYIGYATLSALRHN